MQIFISYRRGGSSPLAERLADHLTARYGRDTVFIDFDAIPPGADFREHIKGQLEYCDLLLVVIDDRWITRASGLFDQGDYVRTEIEIALERSIPIIPVLGDNAKIPTPDTLPPSISTLSYLNAARLHGGKDFHTHLKHLIQAIDRALQGQSDVWILWGRFLKALGAADSKPSNLQARWGAIWRTLLVRKTIRNPHNTLSPESHGKASLRSGLRRFSWWLLSSFWETLRICSYAASSLLLTALSAWLFVLVAILPTSSLPSEEQLAPIWPQVRTIIDALREICKTSDDSHLIRHSNALVVLIAALQVGFINTLLYNMILGSKRLVGATYSGMTAFLGAITGGLFGLSQQPISSAAPEHGYVGIDVPTWEAVISPFLLRGLVDPLLWQGLFGAIVGASSALVVYRLASNVYRTSLYL